MADQARARLDVAINLISGIKQGLPQVEGDLRALNRMLQAASETNAKKTLNVLGLDPTKTKGSLTAIQAQFRTFVSEIEGLITTLRTPRTGTSVFENILGGKKGTGFPTAQSYATQLETFITGLTNAFNTKMDSAQVKMAEESSIAGQKAVEGFYKGFNTGMQKLRGATSVAEFDKIVEKMWVDINSAFAKGTINTAAVEKIGTQISAAFSKLQAKIAPISLIDAKKMETQASAAIKDLGAIGTAATNLGKQISAVDPKLGTKINVDLKTIENELAIARTAFDQFKKALTPAEAEAAFQRIISAIKPVETAFNNLRSVASGTKKINIDLGFDKSLTGIASIKQRLLELEKLIKEISTATRAGGVGPSEADKARLDTYVREFATLMGYTREEAALFANAFPISGLDRAKAAVNDLKKATEGIADTLKKSVDAGMEAASNSIKNDGTAALRALQDNAKEAGRRIQEALTFAKGKGLKLLPSFEAELKGALNNIKGFRDQAQSLLGQLKIELKAGNIQGANDLLTKLKTLGTEGNASLNSLNTALGTTTGKVGDLTIAEEKLVSTSKKAGDSLNKDFGGGADNAKEKLHSLMTLSYQFTHSGFQLDMAGSTLSSMFDKPIEAAKNLQKEIGFVNSLYKGGAAEMETLRRTATELSSQSLFNADEIGKGMKTLALAGLDMNGILKNVKPVMDFAASGMMSLDEAAKFAISTVTAYGLEINKLPQVMDILSRAANVSNTDLASMGKAFEQLGPQAHQLGISVKETAVDVALLSKAGLESGPAATQLRGLYRVLGQLATGTAPKGVQAAFDEMGIKLYKFTSDGKKEFIGLENVVNQFNEKLKDKGGIDQFGKIIELFKQRGGSTGLLSLMEQQRVAIKNNTSAWSELAAAMEKVAGPEELAKRRLDDLFGQMERFGNAINSLMANIGASIAGSGFGKILTILTDVVTGISDLVTYVPALGKIVGGVLALAGAIGALATAAGAVTLTMGILSGIAGLSSPFGDLVKYVGLAKTKLLEFFGIIKVESAATAAVQSETSLAAQAARIREAAAAGQSAQQIAAAELEKQVAMQRTAAVAAEATALINTQQGKQAAGATASATEQVAANRAVETSMTGLGRAAGIMAGLLKGLAVVYVITFVVEGLSNLGTAYKELTKIKEGVGEAQSALQKIFKPGDKAAVEANDTAKNIRDISKEVIALQQKLNLLSLGNTFTAGFGFGEAKRKTIEDIDKLLAALKQETEKFNRDNNLKVGVSPAAAAQAKSEVDALLDRVKKDVEGTKANVQVGADTRVLEEALKGLPKETQDAIRQSLAAAQTTADEAGGVELEGPNFKPGAAQAAAENALDGVHEVLSQAQLDALIIEARVDPKAEAKLAKQATAIQKKIEHLQEAIADGQESEDRRVLASVEKLTEQREDLERRLTQVTEAELHKVGLAQEAAAERAAKAAERSAARRERIEESHASRIRSLNRQLEGENEKLAEAREQRAEKLAQIAERDAEKEASYAEAAANKKERIEETYAAKVEKIRERILELERRRGDVEGKSAESVARQRAAIDRMIRAEEEKLDDAREKRARDLSRVEQKHYNENRAAKAAEAASDRQIEKINDRIEGIKKKMADADEKRREDLSDIKDYTADTKRQEEIAYQASKKREEIQRRIKETEEKIKEVKDKAASTDSVAQNRRAHNLKELEAQLAGLRGESKQLDTDLSQGVNKKLTVTAEAGKGLPADLTPATLGQFLKGGGTITPTELKALLKVEVMKSPEADQWLNLREGKLPQAGEAVLQIAYRVDGKEAVDSSLKQVKISVEELRKVTDAYKVRGIDLGKINLDAHEVNNFPKDFEQMLAEVRQKGSVAGVGIGKTVAEGINKGMIILDVKETANKIETTLISPIEAALTDVDAKARKNFADMAAALPKSMNHAAKLTQAELDAFNAETRRKAEENSRIIVDEATNIASRGGKKLSTGIQGSWDPAEAKDVGRAYAEQAYLGMEEITSAHSAQLADAIIPQATAQAAGAKFGTEFGKAAPPAITAAATATPPTLVPAGVGTTQGTAAGTEIGNAVSPAVTAAVAAAPPKLIPDVLPTTQGTAAGTAAGNSVSPAVTAAVAANPPKLIPDGVATAQGTAAATQIAQGISANDYSAAGSKIGVGIAAGIDKMVTAADPIGTALISGKSSTIGKLSTVLSEMTSKLKSWAASQNITITVKVKKVETKAEGGIVGGMIRGMAAGGKLPGYGGGDRIPALLEAGEYVLPKEVVRNLGLGYLEQLRSAFRTSIPKFNMGVPRMAAGGAVGGGKASPLGSYTLELKTGEKSYPLSGSKVVITQLLEQLRREGMMTR